MGTKKIHMSADALAKKWHARKARIMQQLPRNFKQWCAMCQTVSVLNLTQSVYNRNAKNKRGGNLKRNEKLIYEGPFEAAIVNRARSGEMYPYPLAVHFGRKAITTPTRKGKKLLAWMWNRAHARPTTGEGWRAAIKAGKAAVARSVKAVPARRWRDEMVKDMSGILARMTSDQIMRIVRGS